MIDLIVRLILLHVYMNRHKDCGVLNCVICSKAVALFPNYREPLNYSAFDEMMKKIKSGREEFVKIPMVELQKMHEDNVKAMRKSYGKKTAHTIFIAMNILLELGLDFPQAIELPYQNWFVLDIDWQIENGLLD